MTSPERSLFRIGIACIIKARKSGRGKLFFFRARECVCKCVPEGGGREQFKYQSGVVFIYLPPIALSRAFSGVYVWRSSGISGSRRWRFIFCSFRSLSREESSWGFYQANESGTHGGSNFGLLNFKDCVKPSLLSQVCAVYVGHVTVIGHKDSTGTELLIDRKSLLQGKGGQRVRRSENKRGMEKQSSRKEKG